MAKQPPSLRQRGLGDLSAAAQRRQPATLDILEGHTVHALDPCADRIKTLIPVVRPPEELQERRHPKAFRRKGALADIVVFDPARVIDRSTYQQQSLPPDGISHVLVGGVEVVSGGRVVEGVTPGRAIRARIGS